MTPDSLTIERATDAALADVECLLDDHDLPTADVRDKPPTFVVGRVDGEVVAAGGLETYADAGLLRSVAVADPHRGRGYGAAICDALEARAREAGVRTLYLLTTTAADYFRARGYETVERAAAPDDVRDTTEFTELCSSEAPCMAKELE